MKHLQPSSIGNIQKIAKKNCLSKVVSLLIVFMASVMLYIVVHLFIYFLLGKEFDMREAFFYSTAFATTWTGMTGYRWVKEGKKEKSRS